MDIKDFYEELEKHDWYYDFSDDHSVWEKGNDNRKRLEAIASESEAHQKLFDKFKAYQFSGKTFGIVQEDKPLRKDL